MPKKILLIESHADLIPEMVSTFQGRGFEVLLTSDGTEGMDLAREHAPDLVVLGAEAPKASGYGICGKFKKDQGLRGIPILMTSPEATPKAFQDHAKLKTGRADDYLLMKPFDADQLIEKVGGMIGLPDGAGEEAMMVEAIEDGAEVGQEIALLEPTFEGTERTHRPRANGQAEDVQEVAYDDEATPLPGEAPRAPASARAEAAAAPPSEDIERLQSEIAARDKELEELRESLKAKDAELAQEREKAASGPIQVSGKPGDPQTKTLQQKIDALVAGQKRADRDVASAREEVKQALAKQKTAEDALKLAEEQLGPLRTSSSENEAKAQRLTMELETATARVAELEGQLTTEISRADEVSAELKGVRVQIEDAQETIEGLNRKIADLDDAALKLKDKLKKALGFAQQLLEGAEAEGGEKPPA